jgi:hypothetical protein
MGHGESKNLIRAHAQVATRTFNAYSYKKGEAALLSCDPHGPMIARRLHRGQLRPAGWLRATED